MSFQIAIRPSRRAAARFVGKVRRSLQEALVNNPTISRSDVARAIDVHRSVITKQLNGKQDISVGRIGEIAYALGLEPDIIFRDPNSPADQLANRPMVTPPVAVEVKTSSGATVVRQSYADHTKAVVITG